MSTWVADEEFEILLRDFLPLLEPTQNLDADLRLADWGLDSLATVQVMLEIEDRYSISFPDEEVSADTFLTPQSLWNAISRLVSNV